jgi:hypothetical protein
MGGFFDFLIGLFGGGSRPKPVPPPKRAEEPPPRASIPTPAGVPSSVPPVAPSTAPEVTQPASPAPATPPISSAPVSGDFVANLKAVDPTPLGPEDFAAAAKRLGCEVAALRAVVDVECGPKGTGFDKKGRPTILFEPHWFGQLTVPKYKYNETHPDISFIKWGTKPYPNVEGNWTRLSQAYALDPVAALASTSWGRFQIMGFNHKLCGYANVMDFVQAMLQSEIKQLEAFEKFVRAKEIDDDLAAKRWAGFAQVYNGSGYKANKYDEKLATAYASWKAKGVGV